LRKRRLPARWPTSSFAFQSVNICEAEDEESISPATSADLAAEGNKTRVPAQDAREVVDVSPLGVHGSLPLVTNGQACEPVLLSRGFRLARPGVHTGPDEGMRPLNRQLRKTQRSS
jgi:hypothetical protein